MVFEYYYNRQDTQDIKHFLKSYASLRGGRL